VTDPTAPVYLVLTVASGNFRVLLTPEQFNGLLVDAIWLDTEWNSTTRESDYVEVDPLIPSKTTVSPQVISGATLDAIRVAKRLKETAS